MAITNPGANTQSGRALKPSACESFVRPGQVAPNRPAPDACMRCGRPEIDHHAGPFETERQALDTPAVRAVFTTFEAAPGQGRMQPPNLAMLRAACEGGLVRDSRNPDGTVLAFDPQSWSKFTADVKTGSFNLT